MSDTNKRFPALILAILISLLLAGCQDSGSVENLSGVVTTPVETPTGGTGDPVSTEPSGTTNPDMVTTEISWSIPSTRILGDFLPLSELQGYRIYYGEAQGNYSNTIAIDGAQETNANVTLESGKTYYFIVRAVDTDGFEGPESNTVTRTL